MRLTGQWGGRGRVGLWVLLYRAPVQRRPDGSFDLDAGLMLSVTPGTAWMFSFGAKGLFTFGIGWVTKAERRREEAHVKAHAEGVEHSHE